MIDRSIQPHKFKGLAPEKLEELFSNYLIDNWSYSKLSAFARNEKAFEMNYIYRIGGKKSASEVAGSAYHAALDFYFAEWKAGRNVDIVALQTIAFAYIDEVDPRQWKLQKTTPTIEECRSTTTKNVNQFLEHFVGEVSAYKDDIEEILAVELSLNEFLTINGVDIPLPCRMKIDVVARTKKKKIAVIDHKSKKVFTDEEELRFAIGTQAVTYALGYEERFGIPVDEVWFAENKSSKNKDGSAQVVVFKVLLDADTRRLYESLLYEPLKRMLDAISNPDYIYLINPSDNFVDKAEIYRFWAMTQIAEVGDFNIPENKKQLITNRLKKIRDASLASVDPKTIRKFRENAAEFIQYDLTNTNMSQSQKIEHVLRSFNIPVQVAHTFEGYSSDTFLLEVSAGTTLASIFRYKLDLANQLNVASVRMAKDLFVYKGKSYLSIEAAKPRDKTLIFDPSLLIDRKIPIGMDNFGNVVCWDLDNPSTPHTLVCGSSGSGKSVLMTAILEYALMLKEKKLIDDIDFLDPKYEFLHYIKEVDVANEILTIEQRIEDLVEEMNSLIRSGKKKNKLILFDEFADAVANSRSGNELNVYDDVVVSRNKKTGEVKTKREKIDTRNTLEKNLRILAQKGRSVGFRIIAATQRASTEVITGDAKVNYPVQICFRVPKAVDSKVIIDEEGAESLCGKGDGLIKSPEYSSVTRFQAFYKSNN